jgi:hypothetical protein
MRDLFDTIIARGEAALHELVATRQQESVTLEFKAKVDASHGKLDKGDKRNLAKTLSAFANSQGGLQIWGIDARRESGDEVDCARAVKPVMEIERFKSDVTTLIGELLAPRHDGIAAEAIPSAAIPGAGFLLVRVDRSERRPHMSRAPDDGRYYRRAGGSTYAMEHGDLEDAFNRRRVAALEFAWDWRDGVTMANGPNRVLHRSQLVLGLQSSAVTSARFPYLHVHPQMGCVIDEFGIDGIRNTDMNRGLRDGPWFRFSGGANDVVHPGETLWVAALKVDVICNDRDRTVTLAGLPVINAEVAFAVRYGCIDAVMKIVDVRLPGLKAKFTHPEYLVLPD